MIRFISASVIREYPFLPEHVGHARPACISSMGPLRKARATIALASRTRLDVCLLCLMMWGGVSSRGNLVLEAIAITVAGPHTLSKLAAEDMSAIRRKSLMTRISCHRLDMVCSTCCGRWRAGWNSLPGCCQLRCKPIDAKHLVKTEQKSCFFLRILKRLGLSTSSGRAGLLNGLGRHITAQYTKQDFFLTSIA